MISNPTKQIHLNYGVPYVKERLLKMKDFTLGGGADIKVTEGTYNDALNIFTFKTKARIYGIASAGLQGTVTLTPAGDNQCDLHIEMGRVFGAIDDEYEAQDCQEQLLEFLTTLSTLLTRTTESLNTIKVQESTGSASGSTVGIVLVAIIIFITLLAL